MTVITRQSEGTFIGTGTVIESWDNEQELAVRIGEMKEGEHGWLMLPMGNGRTHDFYFNIVNGAPQFGNGSWSERDVQWVACHIGVDLAKVMTR